MKIYFNIILINLENLFSSCLKFTTKTYKVITFEKRLLRNTKNKVIIVKYNKYYNKNNYYFNFFFEQSDHS